MRACSWGRRFEAFADRLQALKVSAVELENGRSREMLLRLAFRASLVANRVPKLLRAFFDVHGPVRVEIASGSYLAIERMISDGQADIGFARSPLATPGLKEEHVLQARVTCALHRGHQLAERPSLSIADLKGQDLIVLNRERPVRHQLRPCSTAMACANVRFWRPIPSPAPVGWQPKAWVLPWLGI